LLWVAFIFISPYLFSLMRIGIYKADRTLS
jgi:hypothetical protein